MYVVNVAQISVSYAETPIFSTMLSDILIKHSVLCKKESYTAGACIIMSYNIVV